MLLFANRVEAGERLAARLLQKRIAQPSLYERPIVLALPRGGIPVAAPVARALGCPLDVVGVRKIGSPAQPELGVGAVAEGGVSWIPSPTRWTERVAPREKAELERQLAVFRGGRRPAPLQGCTAILVDDGLAMGVSANAAALAARNRGAAHVILAVPVSSGVPVELVDEYFALEVPASFHSVGGFYADFRQVTDEEVRTLLDVAWGLERSSA